MKILLVHNRYREPGGEDENIRVEKNLLEEAGHEVIPFFLDNDELRPEARSALQSVWNRDSYRALRRLLQRERPHVAHFHNTFHRVSPAAYWAAAAEEVPVIQTLHNYRLLCCNGLLFRNGRPCHDCIGKRIPWPGVVHACYRESVGASAAVSAATALHRVIGTWRDRVEVYVALTEFARSIFVGAGLPAAKLVVKPNPVHPDPGVGAGDGGFALFVGRLSREKGLPTLLDAWEQIGPGIPIRIVGDGPLVERVSRARPQAGVEWLGRRPLAEVYELMGKARCLIVPSVCHETFGRVVVEALAKGTPVVVSDAGAPADLVSDGITGFHFRSGDPADLARAVARVFSPHVDVKLTRARARREYESKYTGATNYRMLLAIYTRAIEARSGVSRPAASQKAQEPWD